jgi:hypothetical protein
VCKKGQKSTSTIKQKSKSCIFRLSHAIRKSNQVGAIRKAMGGGGEGGNNKNRAGETERKKIVHQRSLKIISENDNII